MCLLVVKKKNQKPDWNAYESGFISNPDSIGFSVVHNDTVLTSKAFYNFDKFKKAFQNWSNSLALVHFRWSTHGDNTAENCHPFDVGYEAPWSGPKGKLVVAHNGVLPEFYDPKQKSVSDTRQFVRTGIAPLWSPNVSFTPWVNSVRGTVNRMLGSGNKIAMLHDSGQFAIFGENQGHWEKGHWYSNHSYLDPYSWVRTSPADNDVLMVPTVPTVQDIETIIELSREGFAPDEILKVVFESF